MKKAPIPKNEKSRVQELWDYSVLDTDPEKVFDDITTLARNLCGTKISLISLIDSDRQWFKSKSGLDASQTPRDISYCGHAIMGDEIFIVEDADKDERFQDNPLCTGEPYVKFYAGVPLVTPNGQRIGTLCVIDDKPKKLEQLQKDTLKLLAVNVVNLLELRKKNKELEKTLNQSLDIQRMASTGGWELDIKTGKTLWTEEVYHIHKIPVGTPTDKIMGISYYAENEREKILKCVDECILQKKEYDEIFKFYDSEGNQKWVRALGRPELGDDGEVLKLIGTFQDVTQFVEGEKKVNKLNQYLDLALEGANLGIWDWNLSNNAVSFDKRWAEMLGLKVEDIEMTLETWESRVHPDDLEQCYSDIKAYLDGETTSYRNIHRMKHKKGHWVYILDQGKFSGWDEEGKPIRFTGTHLDITKQKLQELMTARLAKEKDVLNQMLQIENHRQTSLKEKLKQALYFVMQSPWGGFFDNCAVLKSENKQNILFVFCGKNEGSTYEIKRKITVRGEKFGDFVISLKDKKEKLIGHEPFLNACVKIFSQMIELHNSQEELIVSRNKALEGQKAKSLFLANMSHEIRTPLNGVLGMVEILSDTKLSTEQKQMLETISSSSLTLLDTLNGVLDLSKIEAGKLELEVAPFNLNESLKQVVELFKFEAVKKSIHLSYKENTNSKKYFKGDVTRVKQIMTNLLSNAIKFTEKGEVKIVCKMKEFHPGKQNVEIVVKDTGIGMDGKAKEKLFQAFTQADNSTTRKYGGTGLGLSICKELVELMNGRIEVSSELGRGTEFKVLLELEEVNSSETCLVSSEKKSREKEDYQLKVLVAEDNKVNQQIAQIMLRNLGCSCDVVENGKEALGQIERKGANYYDVIFMDMQMPIMDGVEATKKIVKSYQECRPSIVAMTANAFKEDRDLCLSAGMDDFLAKPIKKDKIKEILFSLQKLKKSS